MNKGKAVIGVIGCGRKAVFTHLPVLAKLENAQLKYLVDINTERLGQLEREYPGCVCLKDYHELLSRPDLDGVLICTHTHLHYEIAKAFLFRDVDVFTEKPVAMNYTQAKELWELGQSKQRVLDGGVCLRFSNSLQKVKALISAGAIGRVYHISCKFRSFRCIPGAGSDYTDKSKSGGGVLMDLGIHNFDAIDYCLDGVNWKSAAGKCVISPLIKTRNHQRSGYTGTGWNKADVEDLVFGFAEADNGLTLSFEGAWAQNIGDEERYIDFLGDKGGIKFHYYKGYSIWQGEDGAEQRYDCYDGKMYENELQSFVCDILNRRYNSTNSLSNILGATQLIDMIYASDR